MARLMTTQMHDPDQIREFVFAGNARLTLVSRKTGARFTYRVRAPKEPGAVSHFVSVLTGPGNEIDYAYLGHFFQTSGAYVHGRKSSITEDAPSAKAWAYFGRKVLDEGRLPEQIEVWHEGRCGRCGRVLTVPESIERGIGPECAGKL